MISLPYKREENVSSPCQPRWLLLEFRGATPGHTAAKHTNSNEEEKLKVEVRLLLPSHSQEFISTREENTFTTCHTD